MKNKINMARSLLRSRLHAFLNGNTFHPLFVNFECTYRCNMQCSFCNIWKKDDLKNEATTQELENKLIECWDLGCSIIGVTGGEPLLREDIGKLLKFSSRKLGLITGLVTNGILLDKKINEISKHTNFLAVLLQRIESYLVLEIICKRIALERPKLPIYTIHDSIVTTIGNEEYVKSIMVEMLKSYIGHEPKLKFEYWQIEDPF